MPLKGEIDKTIDAHNSIVFDYVNYGTSGNRQRITDALPLESFSILRGHHYTGGRAWEAEPARITF
jgi:hypothetical protein